MRFWVALGIFWMSSVSPAAGITERSECLQKTKSFQLENNESRIKAFKLLHGHKVLLESEQANEGFSIECMMDSSRTKPSKPQWKMEQQKNVSLWEVFLPSAQDTPLKSKGSLDITHSDEFPIRTHILVARDGSEIRLRDSLSSPEKSIQIKCGAHGLSVAVTNKSGTLMEVFRNDFQMDMSIPPVRDLKESVEDYEARIHPLCIEREFSIDTRTGNISELTKSATKRNSPSPSPAGGTR